MINTVVLMGRLTFDPELRTTPSGVSVVRFQVAVDRNYQKAGEERKADFIDVTHGVRQPILVPVISTKVQ